MGPRIKEKYKNEVIPLMLEKYSYKNVMQVPRMGKIVINVGLGEAIQNIKLLDTVQKEIAQITGQRPVQTRSKKAIAAFKLKKGVPIGCKVTLRGDRMYEFFDRLVSLALPRIRDFKGVSTKSFDGRGNYTLGIREQLIFPEIDADKVDFVYGMDITICTTARTDEEAMSLLKYLGMPFRKVSKK